MKSNFLVFGAIVAAVSADGAASTSLERTSELAARSARGANGTAAYAARFRDYFDMDSIMNVDAQFYEIDDPEAELDSPALNKTGTVLLVQLLEEDFPSLYAQLVNPTIFDVLVEVEFTWKKQYSAARAATFVELYL